MEPDPRNMAAYGFPGATNHLAYPQSQQLIPGYQFPDQNSSPHYNTNSTPIVSPVHSGTIYSTQTTPGLFGAEFSKNQTQLPFHPPPSSSLVRSVSQTSYSNLIDTQQSTPNTSQIDLNFSTVNSHGGVSTQSMPTIPTGLLPGNTQPMLSTAKISRRPGDLFLIHEEDGDNSNSSVSESSPPPVSFPNFNSANNRVHSVKSEPSIKRMASGDLIDFTKDEIDLDADQPTKKQRTAIGATITSRPSFTHVLQTAGARQRPQRSATMQSPAVVSRSTYSSPSPNPSLNGMQKKAADDEEVAYGCLNLRLLCNVVPTPDKESFMGGNWVAAIPIELQPIVNETLQTIQAIDPFKNVVGCLSKEDCNALLPLVMADKSIRLKGDIDSHQKGPNEVFGKSLDRELIFTLKTHIFGPAKLALGVGEHLKQSQHRLHSAFKLDAGMKVVNPHIELAPAPKKPPVRAFSMTSQAMPQGKSIEELRTTVQGIFENMSSRDFPEVDTPSNVKTPLLSHQRQGLYFMQARERDDGIMDRTMWPTGHNEKGSFFYNFMTGDRTRNLPVTKGGILGDMMGLGKTLSVLSLIAGSLKEAEEWSQAPVVQRKELKEQQKAKKSQQWEAPRPSVMISTIECNSRATLLICPLSTIDNWTDQIRTHIKPRGLNYYVYHGAGRERDVKKLAQYDLIITTYGSVSTELGAMIKQKAGQYPLEQIGWFRIVLDEAHLIRESSTLQFRAVTRLQSTRRWAVTGTPIQNKLDDLAALLYFLHLPPFTVKGRFNKFIIEPFRACDPDIISKLRILVDAITIRRYKDRIELPPRTDEVIRLEFSDDERFVYDIFKRHASDRVSVLASNSDNSLCGKSYIHVLRSILRLRLICAHGSDLLNAEDLALLDRLTAGGGDNVLSANDDAAPLTAEKANDMFELMRQVNNDACAICSKQLNTEEVAEMDEISVVGYMNPCFHIICRSCIKNFRSILADSAAITGSNQTPCPLCSNPLVVPAVMVEIRKSSITSESGKTVKATTRAANKADRLAAYRGPSTKVNHLIASLLETQARSAALPAGTPPYKSVVFSGWTSHLDLIEHALSKTPIRSVRLDGTMNRFARTSAMESFRIDPTVTVILVSISAGGLGLNLTAGNTVYVMEPQFNPAMEAQAVDRVHRLGQTRPVRTVRYIMNGSFEEKMEALQEKKVQLANLSMDSRGDVSRGEAVRQKLMDLQSLFK